MSTLPARQIVGLVAILLVGGFLAGTVAVFRAGRSTAYDVSATGPMPVLDAPGMQGGRVSPALYRGKVVVVNFWASWCGPCRREQPDLERLSRELTDEAQFLGVNFRDDRAAALAYLDEFGVTYPSVEDRDGLLAHEFGMLAPPTTFLVDRRGQLRYQLLGAQSEATLRRYLDELLEERA